MDDALVRFGMFLFGALILADIVAVVLLSPDPFSQLLVAGVLMIAALPLAYGFAYRGGYEYVRKRLDR